MNALFRQIRHQQRMIFSDVARRYVRIYKGRIVEELIAPDDSQSLLLDRDDAVLGHVVNVDKHPKPQPPINLEDLPEIPF